MAAIGMIWLGQIGLPMAENLIKAGHEVIGRWRGERKDLVDSGGVAAAGRGAGLATPRNAQASIHLEPGR
jgi:3-hydroxyisobutyrate dehydrogenase-like beta-hydroxyacid dehydrogenase